MHLQEFSLNLTNLYHYDISHIQIDCSQYKFWQKLIFTNWYDIQTSMNMKPEKKNGTTVIKLY
jgi:hypothetical protein